MDDADDDDADVNWYSQRGLYADHTFQISSTLQGVLEDEIQYILYA